MLGRQALHLPERGAAPVTAAHGRARLDGADLAEGIRRRPRSRAGGDERRSKMLASPLELYMLSPKTSLIIRSEDGKLGAPPLFVAGDTAAEKSISDQGLTTIVTSGTQIAKVFTHQCLSLPAEAYRQAPKEKQEKLPEVISSLEALDEKFGFRPNTIVFCMLRGTQMAEWLNIVTFSSRLPFRFDVFGSEIRWAVFIAQNGELLFFY